MRPSALGAGITAAVITATAATPPHATGFVGIGSATIRAAAVAAVLPATGSGAAGGLAVTATTGAGPAAAAVAATAITPITASTGTGTTTLGLRLVDAQRPTHQLRALEGIDRLGLQFRIDQLDKGETALASRVALQRERTVSHLTEGCE